MNNYTEMIGNDIQVDPNSLSNASRDLSRLVGKGQRRVKPYRIGESLIMQAPTGRHNSILNRWVNVYIIAKLYVKEKISR